MFKLNGKIVVKYVINVKIIEKLWIIVFVFDK